MNMINAWKYSDMRITVKRLKKGRLKCHEKGLCSEEQVPKMFSV